VLFAVNILLIPEFSYWACAWGGVAGYGVAMVLSYVVGQKKNPIAYPMKDIALYTLTTAILFIPIWYTIHTLPAWASLSINTLLIGLFLALVVKKDFPLSSLPVIGKHFRK